MLENLSKRMTENDAKKIIQHWAPLLAEPPVIKESQEITNVKDKEIFLPSWDHTQSVQHPVFGEQLVDLGYKRVFLTSVAALVLAPVWEKQRILRHDRASRIAASKVQLGREKIFPGVITMFEDKKTGKSGIVDGQHRAAAYLILAQQGHINVSSRNIVIDVFSTSNDDEVSALFKEINSAEPVMLVDMPGEGASFEIKEILDSFTEKLSGSYPEMFKPSLKCKPPHVNADLLRDEVFQADIIGRRGLKSVDELLDVVSEWNKKVAGPRSDQDWEKILLSNGLFKTKNKSLDQAVRKARENDFFLGLDPSWMHS